VTHSVDRQSSLAARPLSPNASVSPKQADADTPVNERFLRLVTTLSERVMHLENKLNDSLEPRKRPTTEHLNDDPVDLQRSPPTRPSKQARLTPFESARTEQQPQNDEGIRRGNEAASGQHSPDAEAEDAATVLEFLAWGRLKDSNLTTDARHPGNVHELATYPEKDVLQTTQAWGSSSDSVSVGNQLMENLQMSQIQEMLPGKEQVVMMIDYHAKWILFMHCSFHTQTFKRELEHFYEVDNGIINMTTTGLQWTSLLFALICASMTCAKASQVARWGFHPGPLSCLLGNPAC
jgi:hypothetical protein